MSQHISQAKELGDGGVATSFTGAREKQHTPGTSQGRYNPNLRSQGKEATASKDNARQTHENTWHQGCESNLPSIWICFYKAWLQPICSAIAHHLPISCAFILPTMVKGFSDMSTVKIEQVQRWTKAGMTPDAIAEFQCRDPGTVSKYVPQGQQRCALAGVIAEVPRAAPSHWPGPRRRRSQ